MEQDSTRMCELLVGLGDVDVLGVVDEPSAPLVVHVNHAAPAGVFGLWWVGVVQGHQRGEFGGFAGVRPSGAPGVAQASLVLPSGGLCDGFVHRGRR